MQELLNKLMSEVGLSAEQAQKTMTTVVDFVKSKVPGPLAANIDAMFSGAKGEMKEQTYADKAGDFAEATKDKLEDLAEQAKEKLGDVADKAEDMAKDALNKLKGFFGGDEKKEA
ncbi:MAG: YtxH domain-containing protein [Chitinophagaceae bacterium]|nr:YtxH domain-containing protein [Chitinophagaceae bacterium]